MTAATACALLGVVALARQASPPAWLGPGVWALLVLVIAATAWRLARALCGGEAPLAVQALATALLGLVFAAVVVTWLGFAGALSLGSALLLTGGAAAAVVRFAPSARMARGAPPTSRAASPSRAWSASGLVISAPDPVSAAAVALAIVPIGLVVLSQVRYVTSSVDGLWYHLPMVAEWMQRGSIWAVDGLSLVYRGYPGFRESVLILLSLPLHQEHLALLGLVEFPLFALAVFALATSCGAPPRLGALLAAYAVSAPVVARASTSQKNDLLLAIAFAVAVVFSSRLVERPTLGHGVLTGAALGALAATKFTGLGYAAVVVAIGVGRRWLAARAGASLVREAAPWAWGAGVALLVAGPWYARTLVSFGNPFYPAEVSIGSVVLFKGPLGKDAIAAETVGWNLGPLIDASGLFVEAYGPLVPLAGLGTVALALAALAWRPVGRRHAWLLALAAACVAIFVHQPLNMPAQSDYHYTFRYFTPAFVVLAIAALAVVTAAPRVAVAATAVLLVAGTLVNLGSWARGWWVAVAAALAATAAGWAAARRGRRLSVPRLRVPAGMLGALVALAVVAAGLNALRARWQYHPVYGYPAALANRGGAGEVWAHAHRTLARQRIVAYGMEPTFPLYGDDLSNLVVAVREPLAPDALLSLCDAERADYLVVFFPVPGGDGGWSPTMAATLLAQHPSRVSVAFSSDRTFLLKIRLRP